MEASEAWGPGVGLPALETVGKGVGKVPCRGAVAPLAPAPSIYQKCKIQCLPTRSLQSSLNYEIFTHEEMPS